MALTERERETQFLYDRNGQDWLDHSGGRNRPPYWSHEMKLFELSLPKHSKIIEVGCGPATDGKFFESIGMQAVSVDYSSTMLRIAKEINPKAKLSQMDSYSLAVKDDAFDGFWATATILHMENPKAALSELSRVTKPGGIGFISIKEGEGEGMDAKTGFYFKYYQHDEFKNLLAETGLSLLRAAKRPGTPSHAWLTYLVRVNK